MDSSSTSDLPTDDAGDNGAGDNGAGDSGAGDSGAGDSGAGDSGAVDAADVEQDQYQAISVTAVLALSLGILSIASVWSLLFAVVGLLAIVCGILALRAIAYNPQHLTGRRAALIGIGLGLTFLVVAPVQLLVRDYLLRARAEQYAARWLDLVSTNQLQLAHQLTLVPRFREPRGTDLQQYYENSPRSQQDLSKLFSEEPIRTLATKAEQVRIEPQGVLGVQDGGSLEYVVLRYDLHDPGPPTARVIPLRVVLEHSLQPNEHGSWRIHSTSEILPKDE